jgi:hypothetical protein
MRNRPVLDQVLFISRYKYACLQFVAASQLLECGHNRAVQHVERLSPVVVQASALGLAILEPLESLGVLDDDSCHIFALFQAAYGLLHYVIAIAAMHLRRPEAFAVYDQNIT